MSDLHFPGPENIYRTQLPNGIVLLVYENFASQSVVVEGLVRAGALVETRAKAGLANFATSLLLRGTAKRDFAQIYEDLESVGAELGFSSGYFTTNFLANALVEDLPLVLDLVAQSLRYPTFPENQVELVRGHLITGLQIRANDTQRMANLAFHELLYENHPYGRSSRGYLDSVPAITHADICEFHADYFGPRGMIMIIVGAISVAEAEKMVTAVLGDWQHPTQKQLPEMPPMPRPNTLHRTHILMPEKSQSDIIMGLPGPRRSEPDYLDASLMNTILGVFGMMGRIGQNVREAQNLAYYAYSRLHGGLGPSPWYASAGVAPDAVEQAITSILAEIQRIQDELVPLEELEDSQAYRTGSLPVSLETNEGLANIIIDMELYGLGLDYLQSFPDLIRAITPERIQAAAQKYLSTDQLVIAVAGDERSED